MKTEITTAARRIAKLHNARQASSPGSGFIVCGTDGSGGYWYSGNSRPRLASDEIAVQIRWERMTSTKAQEILDNRHGQ